MDSDGTLRIERVQLSDAGNYECEAINGLGSTKALARLEVKGKGHSQGHFLNTVV